MLKEYASFDTPTYHCCREMLVDLTKSMELKMKVKVTRSQFMLEEYAKDIS